MFNGHWIKSMKISFFLTKFLYLKCHFQVLSYFHFRKLPLRGYWCQFINIWNGFYYWWPVMTSPLWLFQWDVMHGTGIGILLYNIRIMTLISESWLKYQNHDSWLIPEFWLLYDGSHYSLTKLSTMINFFTSWNVTLLKGNCTFTL